MNINKSVASIIASDTQTTIRSVDMALAQQGRMCADFADACLESDVTISSTQPVMEALGKSLAGLIESRGHLNSATRELTRIQRSSNLRETSFGCPKGWVEFPKAEITGKEVEANPV
jgi:hypothetical protein